MAMQVSKEYREYCNFCGYSRTITAAEYEKLSKLNKGFDSLPCPACGAGNKNWPKGAWVATANRTNSRDPLV
jgi:hypothetical protein